MTKLAILALALMLIGNVQAQEYTVCPNDNDCVFQYEVAGQPAYACVPIGPYPDWVECAGVAGDSNCDGTRDYCRGESAGGVTEECGPGCADCCVLGMDCPDYDCLGTQASCSYEWRGYEFDGMICHYDNILGDASACSALRDRCYSSPSYCNYIVNGREAYLELSGSDDRMWCMWGSNPKDPANTALGQWYDLDESGSLCEDAEVNLGLQVGTWTDAVCERTGCDTFDATGSYCCGDDDREYYNYRWVEEWFSQIVSFSTVPSDDYCCQGENSCVYNQQCYPESTLEYENLHDVGGETDLFCAAGGWLDMDGDQVFCELLGPSPFHYVPAGEANVGEYDDQFPAVGGTQCCGDDENEYYTDGICCNSAWDENQGGVCVSGLQCDEYSTCGDITGDGSTNLFDVLAATDILNGVEPMPSDICCLDANNDGSFGNDDLEIMIDVAMGTASCEVDCCKTKPPTPMQSNIFTDAALNFLACSTGRGCGEYPGYVTIFGDLEPITPRAVAVWYEGRSWVNGDWAYGYPAEDGFRVYRSEHSLLSSAVLIDEIPAVDNEAVIYWDYAVEPCKVYYYWLSAYNHCGESFKAASACTSLFSVLSSYDKATGKSCNFNIHVTEYVGSTVSLEWDSCLGSGELFSVDVVRPFPTDNLIGSVSTYETSATVVLEDTLQEGDVAYITSHTLNCRSCMTKESIYTCQGEGMTCQSDDSCCETSAYPGHEGMPMSCGAPNAQGVFPSDKRCCPNGFYYDPAEGCIQYASCHDPLACPFYVYDTSSWWNDLLCIPNPASQQACCPAELIDDPWNDGLYHYWNIKAYD